jgi:hypothetical protein
MPTGSCSTPTSGSSTRIGRRRDLTSHTASSAGSAMISRISTMDAVSSPGGSDISGLARVNGSTATSDVASAHR